MKIRWAHQTPDWIRHKYPCDDNLDALLNARSNLVPAEVLENVEIKTVYEKPPWIGKSRILAKIVRSHPVLELAPKKVKRKIGFSFAFDNWLPGITAEIAETFITKKGPVIGKVDITVHSLFRRPTFDASLGVPIFQGQQHLDTLKLAVESSKSEAISWDRDNVIDSNNILSGSSKNLNISLVDWRRVRVMWNKRVPFATGLGGLKFRASSFAGSDGLSGSMQVGVRRLWDSGLWFARAEAGLGLGSRLMALDTKPLSPDAYLDFFDDFPLRDWHALGAGELLATHSSVAVGRRLSDRVYGFAYWNAMATPTAVRSGHGAGVGFKATPSLDVEASLSLASIFSHAMGDAPGDVLQKFSIKFNFV